MSYSKIIQENNNRIQQYFRDYNRNLGDSKGETIPRVKLDFNGIELYVPEVFANQPICKALNQKSVQEIITELKGYTDPYLEKNFIHGFINERITQDFEYFCFLLIKIQDKLSKQYIPFKLNTGQRILIREFEDMRLSGLPIRVVLVKARQWGGSTVIAVYMLWLQLYHYSSWHSAIVAQYKGQSTNIRSMISGFIKGFPSEALELSLKAFEGSSSTRYIPERGCRITIGSAENPDALRSFDFSMIHLSECGLWKSTPTKSADDLAMALYATVPEVEGTFICLESTAKGIGTFFHKEYLLASKGESISRLVFVPWFKIINYADFKTKDQKIVYENNIPISNIKDYEKEIEAWTEYDKYLWDQGATIEGIKWYNWYKKGKRLNDFQMKSEYPTTAEEAFQTNASNYFPLDIINKAKKFIDKPIYQGDIRGDSLIGKGSLNNIHLSESNLEELYLWAMPDPTPYANRYLITVDVGGKSAKSDWGTINIFDRLTIVDEFGALERVGTWRGHIDPDVFAWKAVQLAVFYNNAFLVIESNTIETRLVKSSDTIREGNHFYTVLNEIAEEYDNLYIRGVDPDKSKDGTTFRYGFHMNKQTKYLAYDSILKAIREGRYVEKDIRCVDEMSWLEIKDNGSLEAIPGEHDDIIDPTAIACYISEEKMPPPILLKTRTVNNSKPSSIATF